MRYQRSEHTHIMGKFDPGDAITMDIYKVSTGATVAINASVCTEIASHGVFVWSTSNIATLPASKAEYLWVMNNGTFQQFGKFIWGGYIDNFSFTGSNVNAQVAGTDDIDFSDTQKATIKSKASQALASVFTFTGSNVNARIKATDDIDFSDTQKASVKSKASEAIASAFSFTGSNLNTKVQQIATDVITPAALAVSAIAILYTESKYIDRTITKATGAVSAQGITAEMAESGCIQYVTVKISKTMDFSSPDLTYYELYHYDGDGKVDHVKPSTTTTW